MNMKIKTAGLILLVVILIVGSYALLSRGQNTDAPSSYGSKTSQTMTEDEEAEIAKEAEETDVVQEADKAPDKNSREDDPEVKGVEDELKKSMMQFSQPPEMALVKGKNYSALLKTSKGDIIIDLFEEKTPITVNNFVFLAKKGFYHKTIFHRVIKGFMIQGGDPMGTGAGGPGYRFDDESFEGEYTRGTVAMANAGPNTNGSQFFIMHQDYKLAQDYVIFGKVLEGMDIVDAIATAKTIPEGEQSTPAEPVTVESVDILEK